LLYDNIKLYNIQIVRVLFFLINFLLMDNTLEVTILIIGTTPTFTLKVTDDESLDFTTVDKIYFTIRQGSIIYTKTGEDITIIDEHTLSVTFTQEETLAFRYNLTAEI